jgi:hypothetical protein
VEALVVALQVAPSDITGAFYLSKDLGHGDLAWMVSRHLHAGRVPELAQAVEAS